MKKKSRGFTLVELLVAVAILAIIVSIAFALYNNFSKGAKETATVITKQNLVNAAQLYAKEFKTNPDFWYEEIINDDQKCTEYINNSIYNDMKWHYEQYLSNGRRLDRMIINYQFHKYKRYLEQNNNETHPKVKKNKTLNYKLNSQFCAFL